MWIITRASGHVMRLRGTTRNITPPLKRGALGAHLFKVLRGGNGKMRIYFLVCRRSLRGLQEFCESVARNLRECREKSARVSREIRKSIARNPQKCREKSAKVSREIRKSVARNPRKCREMIVRKIAENCGK